MVHWDLGEYQEVGGQAESALQGMEGCLKGMGEGNTQNPSV